MAVEMIKQIKDKGVKVGELVMDDDTTTITRIHQEVDPEIMKCSDKNHVFKAFTSCLYDIQKNNKGFYSNHIKYFKRLFSLAICQNQGDETKLAEELKKVVPHAFGCHTDCNSSWCEAISMADPIQYKYKGLPRHKPMIGKHLRTSLANLFNKYANQAKKLCNLKSSQANESLNKSISLKAPKSHHYSSSGSLFHRVSAAVAEKNEGPSYVMKVLY